MAKIVCDMRALVKTSTTFKEIHKNNIGRAN